MMPFPETADIETSNDDYAKRFSGAVGAWMLAVQERIALALLRPAELRATGAARILDVGGGHGQLAHPLCAAGCDVTVLGSDESCRHRIRELLADGRCRFTVGNVVELPFDDGAFDAVIAFRLLTHCTAWPRLVHELCRVSRGPVVVDYPTAQSLNAVAPMLFGAKKRIERNTRSWQLFRHAEVRAAFEAGNYVVTHRRAQFFLPMVLHRALRSRTLSSALEGLCRGSGLTALAGSPVIIRAVPRAAGEGHGKLAPG